MDVLLPYMHVVIGACAHCMGGPLFELIQYMHTVCTERAHIIVWSAQCEDIIIHHTFIYKF